VLIASSAPRRCDQQKQEIRDTHTHHRSHHHSFADDGRCDQQKQEIREAVELPLTHHDLYSQV